MSIIDAIYLKFLCDIYDEKIKVNFLTKMTPDDWMRVSTKKITHALHLFRSITSTYWFINRLKTFGYLEVHEVWYGATRFGKSKMFDGTKFAYRPTDKAREYFKTLEQTEKL